MCLGPTEARLDEGCKAQGPTAKDKCPLPRPPGREEEPSEQKKNLDREDPKEKGRRAEKEAPQEPDANRQREAPRKSSLKQDQRSRQRQAPLEARGGQEKGDTWAKQAAKTEQG